ncbi:MAG TPA: Asp-tRNA(Asn)/Glu-tRNA(Gln) amidotransferase subunit GatA [Firmicutes bacterium]|nr:Asp-tRNA(Asn)/Glu-tRNA(Gln) amidotransferase subunit GatA [Bacillota bacterium]
MEIHELTLTEVQDLLDRGELSGTDLVEGLYTRIDAVEDKVQAFLELDRERALAEAKEAGKAQIAREADPGPRAGVPVAVKDNVCTMGWKTTCASRILFNFRPPYDATVVARLRQQGHTVLGKTNMDEFAMGSSTEHSAFHPTRNPWDLTRVPGGSSGGSAAAVAAGEALFALGSDTGGSIRLPAAFCGVVGLKPTYGRVSRYGLVAYASSLDQIGPITRTVADCALALGWIAGHDPLDSTSLAAEVPDYRTFLRPEVRGLRIGLPKEYFGEGLDPEVRGAVEKAVQQLEEGGAAVLEVSLPHTEYALAAYYLIAPAEASSNLARYDGVRYGFRGEGSDIVELYSDTRRRGFGDEVKRRIMLGTYALSAGYYDAYYLNALRVRTLIRRDFEAAFQKVDVLACPTSPTVAFRLGERTDDPMQMYLSDIYTVPVNLAGLPALSVPCGLNHEGLPIGLQLIGPPLSEGRLLQVGYAYEERRGPFPRPQL